MPKQTKDYQVVENKKTYKPVVGSVMTLDDGTRVLYRDINTKKHFFSKGGYTALSTDDEVITYLSTNDEVDEVHFNVTDKGVTYTTSFKKYEQAQPKFMAGRSQRFVNIAAFQELPGLRRPRPSMKMEI